MTVLTKIFASTILFLAFLSKAQISFAQTEPGDDEYYKAANILADKEQARARFSEMLQLYITSADKGNTKGMVVLAQYYRAINNDSNYFKYGNMAARHNSPEGYFQLAEYYYYRANPKNEDLAEINYQQAADNGWQEAYVTLADFYNDKWSKRKGADKAAFKYTYMAAVNLGNKYLGMMGSYYHRGYGCVANHDSSYYWFKQYAVCEEVQEHGNDYAWEYSQETAYMSKLHNESQSFLAKHPEYNTARPGSQLTKEDFAAQPSQAEIDYYKNNPTQAKQPAAKPAAKPSWTTTGKSQDQANKEAADKAKKEQENKEKAYDKKWGANGH